MNFKNLLKLSTLALLLTLVFGSVMQAQTVRYLNSTDGDDRNSGRYEVSNPDPTSPDYPYNGPKRTVEGAYKQFPDGTTVYMKAGEYYYNEVYGLPYVVGNDLDGINMTWTAAVTGTLNSTSDGKSMKFVIQTYSFSPLVPANVVYFNGSGDLTFDFGTGTVAFVAATSGINAELISLNDGPHNAIGGTRTVTLLSGTLDLVGGSTDVPLGAFNVGPNYTTMTRTVGKLTTNSAFTYSDPTVTTRLFNYNSTATTAQTAGGELGVNLAAGTLQLNNNNANLTIPQNLTATSGGMIQNLGTKTMTFSGTVGINGGAAVPSRILNNSTGTMSFTNAVVVQSQNASWNTGGYFIRNNGASPATLQFTSAGTLTFVHGGTTAADLAGTVDNVSTGTLTLSGVIAFTPYTTGGTTYYPLFTLLNNVAGKINIGATGSVWYNYINNSAGGSVTLTGDLTMKTSTSTTPAISINLNNANSTFLVKGYTLTINSFSSTAAINFAGPFGTNFMSSTGIGVGLLKFTHAAGTVYILGDGAIPNIEVGAAGNVIAASVTHINGNVLLSASGDLTLGAVPTILVTGSVTLSGNAAVLNVTTNAPPSTGLTINKDFTLNGPATMNLSGVVTLYGNFTQTDGVWNFVNAGGRVIQWTVGTGALVLNGDVLDVKGNFTRVAGAFDYLAGTLRLSGGTIGISQILNGGTNFAVYNLWINYTSSMVTLDTGSIMVINQALVDINATLYLGDLNLRMVGNTSQTTIVNHGNIITSDLGSVIMEGANNPTGGADLDVHRIGGDGKYTNIDIKLTDYQDRVNVISDIAVSPGQKLLWTGRLNLVNGGIFIPNSCQVNPVQSTVAGANPPSIWANLGGAPNYQTFGITGGGTGVFNYNGAIYDLLFYGQIVTSAKNIADVDNIPGGTLTIFQSGYVRNLSQFATGSSALVADVNNAKTILGAVSVASGCWLRTTADLTSLVNTPATWPLQAAVTHTINGSVTEASSATPKAWILDGSGNHTVVGGTATANASLVHNLTVAATETGTVNINNLKVIGEDVTPAPVCLGLQVMGGTVNLGMQPSSSPYTPGDVYKFVQTGGVVDLTADMEIPSAGNATQFYVNGPYTFDFNTFNVWQSSSFLVQSSSDAVFLATGASSASTGTSLQGFLQIRASSTINLGGALIPRIIVDPTKAGAIALQCVTGNSGVSQFLTIGNTDATAGAFTSRLDLNGRTFTHAGTVWNHISGYSIGGGDTRNYGTSGTFTITGNTTLYMYGAGATTGSVDDYSTCVDPDVPNFTVNQAAGNTFTLARQANGKNNRTLEVASLFTFTKGAVNFDTYDIAMLGTGAVFSFATTGGTFNAVTQAAYVPVSTTTGLANLGPQSNDDANGELIFNGAAANAITLNAACSIQNARVDGTIGVALTMTHTTATNLTVTKRFVFGTGHTITFGTVGNPGNLVFGDGTWVERRVATPASYVAAGAYAATCGLFTNAPVFPTAPGVIDLYYNLNSAFSTAGVPGATVTYSIAKEMPAAGTTLRNLYVEGYVKHTNTGPSTVTYVDGVTLNAIANMSVNSNLQLVSGTLGLGSTPFTLAMGNPSVAIRTNGYLTGGSLSGGPIKLYYNNYSSGTTGFVNQRTTTTNEYPSTAAFVSTLYVQSNTSTQPALKLHDNRSCGDFVLETGAVNTSTPVNTVQFDLWGKLVSGLGVANTLTVTNTTSATLTRGILIDTYVDTYGNWAFGTLNAAGNLTSTVNTNIYNVNLFAKTANLVGGVYTYDLDALAPAPPLPLAAGPGNLVGLILATFNNTDASPTNTNIVTNFLGNILTFQSINIQGTYIQGTLTAYKDVTVTTTPAGTLSFDTNIVFKGTSALNNATVTFTVPAFSAPGCPVGSLTFDKNTNASIVTLAGGSIFQQTNMAYPWTYFIRGLFIVPSPLVFQMNQPDFGNGQGFTKATPPNVSHVVGTVAKVSYNSGWNIQAGSSEPRFEFPVGTGLADGSLYRPAALTFNPAVNFPTMPNRTFYVSHTPTSPTGVVGMPLKDAVAPGVDVGRYPIATSTSPGFFWTIKVSPNDLGPSTYFDMEFGAANFSPQYYDNHNNIRVVRRYGTPTEVNNTWDLQGTPDSYYNEQKDLNFDGNFDAVNVTQKNANAGLRTGGAIFTLGLTSNLRVKTQYAKQWMWIGTGTGAGARTFNLVDVLGGKYVFEKSTFGVYAPFTTLPMDVTTSPAGIVTASISTAGVLTVTPVGYGNTVVTVIATDASTGNLDRCAMRFDVNVGITDVAVTEQLPTEFALFQNFPNPFNPTTNIKFDLPKESNVMLKVYNILGAEVATLVDKVMPAGHQSVTFDATKLASGMYIYRIQAGDFVQIKKMLLMK